MRAIDRGNPPDALTTLLAADPDREWSSGGEPEVHESIKEGLRHVQNRVCAYCEQPIPREGRIEHVHPKSARPCLSRPCINCHYDWNNLFLVCGSANHCDGPKANKDLCAQVLFPDDMQPHTDYFTIDSLTGELHVSPSLDGADRGRATGAIRELCLNDPGLKRQRRGVIRLIAKQMQDSGSAALARHIARSGSGFPTTVDLYMS